MDKETTFAMFRGVRPGWKNIILKHEGVRSAMNKALMAFRATMQNAGITAETMNDHLLPRVDQVLEPFRYFEPEDLKVIIIGQDPYPTPGHACGLCFSVAPGVKPPPSLMNIYGCLQKTGQINGTPITGDLRAWARQGVLMLNRYLTRCADKMHKYWAVFTDALLFHLSRDIARSLKLEYVAVLLWGKEAQTVTRMIEPGVFRIYEWGHPSPLSRINFGDNPNAFCNCDHFALVNDELRKRGKPLINWNPGDSNMAKVVVAFTDGGCLNNGYDSAVASYGVYFPASYQNKPTLLSRKVFGLVPDKTLELKNGHILCKSESANPTNNRGELLAVVHALAHTADLIKQTDVDQVIIVTDSTYVQGLIEKRLERYTDEDLNSGRILNADIILIIRAYAREVGLARIRVIHQRGHTSGTDEMSSGNREADSLCSKALENCEIYKDYIPRIC